MHLQKCLTFGVHIKSLFLTIFKKDVIIESRVSQMIAGTDVREESPGSIEQGAG